MKKIWLNVCLISCLYSVAMAEQNAFAQEVEVFDSAYQKDDYFETSGEEIVEVINEDVKDNKKNVEKKSESKEEVIQVFEKKKEKKSDSEIVVYDSDIDEPEDEVNVIDEKEYLEKEKGHKKVKTQKAKTQSLTEEIVYPKEKKSISEQETEIIVYDENETKKDKMDGVREKETTAQKEKKKDVENKNKAENKIKKKQSNTNIVKKKSTKELNDEDVVIVSMRVKKYNVSDGVAIYLNGDDTYIPLSEFFELMSFPIIVYDEEGKADGYFITKDKKFTLDYKNKTVVADGKKFDIEDEEIIYIDGMLYATQDAISKWLSLGIDFKLGALSLQIVSDEKLPIEIQKEIEERRKHIAEKQKLQKYDKRVIEINDKISLPAIDVTYSKQYYKNKNDDKNVKTETDSYFLNMSNSIYNFDNSLYFYGKDDGTKQLRFTSKKYQPFNDKSFFKDVELGDVRSSDINLVSTSSMGRGLFISSLSDSRVSANRTINIGGFLPEGYQAELYKNGQIIDFVTAGNDGTYEFKDVIVSTGLNIFKIVLVGPYGEQREEEKRIYVSPTAVGSGEFEMTASLTQDERYLVDFNNENDKKSKNVKANIEMAYGVTSSFAVSLAYSRAQDPANKDVMYNFAQTGLHFATPIGSVETFTAMNADLNKSAYSISMTNQIYDWTLLSRYENYNGIHSETSLFSGEFTDDMMEFRLTGRFGIPYVGKFPLYARYKRYSLKKKDYEDKNKETIQNTGMFETNTIWQDGTDKLYAEEKILRLSYPVKNFNFGAEYNQTSYFTETQFSTASLKAIYKYNIATIKAEGVYDIEPNRKMQTSSARLDLKMSNDFSVYSEYQHSFISNIDSYMFGLTKRTDYGNFSFATMLSSSDEKSILFSYNIGLFADQKNLSYMTQKYNNATSTGSAKLKAFVDTNANSLFDDGEEVLKDVKIKASSMNEKNQYTDENGEIVVTGISPYELSVFKVNVDNLEDISYTPTETEFGYVPRPGYCEFIDVPIIQVADVEGAVFNNIGKKNVPLRGIIVKLVNEEGKEVKQIISESDGSFMLSNVPYGKYTVMIDEKQIDDLKFEDMDPIEITVDEPYKDVPSIKLKRKKSLI